MRVEVSRGSGSVMSVALIGLAITVMFGGLYGAATLFRVTGALRSAELAAITVATRALAGDPTPCEPAIPTVASCSIDGLVATTSINRDGTRATATAGPER
jgi:hypothetical protein